ncbi:hypothetical protein NPIL_518111, partial [Nephila pilipes]
RLARIEIRPAANCCYLNTSSVPIGGVSALLGMQNDVNAFDVESCFILKI